MPPLTAVRRWQKSRRIYVRQRTGPQSAHLWRQAVATLQAASVPIAQAAAPWDRQTGGSRYSKIPPYGWGMITGCPVLHENLYAFSLPSSSALDWRQSPIHLNRHDDKFLSPTFCQYKAESRPSCYVNMYKVLNLIIIGLHCWVVKPKATIKKSEVKLCSREVRMCPIFSTHCSSLLDTSKHFATR